MHFAMGMARTRWPLRRGGSGSGGTRSTYGCTVRLEVERESRRAPPPFFLCEVAEERKILRQIQYRRMQLIVLSRRTGSLSVYGYTWLPYVMSI